MAAFNIVIRATNTAKGAFDAVGQRAEALHRRMQKLNSVMRGLFVAGLAAAFVQQLVKASTYTQELQAAGGRMKDAWSGAATVLGDMLAKSLLAIEPLISKVGELASKMAEATAAAWAYFEALVKTGSLEQAGEAASGNALAREGRQVMRDEAASEKARTEAAKKAVDDQIKAEERLAEKRKKLEESSLSTAELIARRKQEIYEQEDIAKFGGTETMDRIAAEEKIIDLQTELGRLEKQQAQERIARIDALVAEDVARIKAKEDAEKKARDNWIAAEREKMAVAKRNLQDRTRAEIDSLRTEARAKRDEAKDYQDKAEQVEEAIEDRRRMLAQRRADGRTLIGGGTATRRMEREAEELRAKAEMSEREASEKETKAHEASATSARHLASIDSKIEKLLTLRG